MKSHNAWKQFFSKLSFLINQATLFETSLEDMKFQK